MSEMSPFMLIFGWLSNFMFVYIALKLFAYNVTASNVDSLMLLQDLTHLSFCWCHFIVPFRTDIRFTTRVWRTSTSRNKKLHVSYQSSGCDCHSSSFLLAKCQSQYTMSLTLTFRNKKLSYCRYRAGRSRSFEIADLILIPIKSMYATSC